MARAPKKKITTPKGGRPASIQDDDIVNDLIRELRSGAPIRIACGNAGISSDTYYNWQAIGIAYRDNDEAFFEKLGRKPQHAERYIEFVAQVERAQDYILAKAHRTYHDILETDINRTADNMRDWVKFRELQMKVAQRILEGRDPDNNAKDRNIKQQLEHGFNEETMKLFRSVSPDDWDEEEADEA